MRAERDALSSFLTFLFSFSSGNSNSFCTSIVGEPARVHFYDINSQHSFELILHNQQILSIPFFSFLLPHLHRQFVPIYTCRSYTGIGNFLHRSYIRYI
jgi:hypothetical protein